MSVGKNIKQARINAGLTQRKLGELCGMADSAIRRYENGGANPKKETIDKIAQALNISACFITHGSHGVSFEDLEAYLPIFKTITPSMEFNSWEDIKSYDDSTFVTGTESVNLQEYESKDFNFIVFILPDNSLSPRFCEGDLAIVDITKEVIEGELLVLQNDDNAVLRYYDDSIDPALIRGRVVEIRSRNLSRLTNIEDWTNSEVKEIEEFKKYVRSKRTEF